MADEYRTDTNYPSHPKSENTKRNKQNLDLPTIHVIVLGQGHLERLLREFIEEYYHVARPHQGLNGDTPVSQTKQPQI